MTDFRSVPQSDLDLIADLIPYLVPEDIVIRVTPVSTSEPDTLIDPIKTLMRITGAKTEDQIGEKGPPVAATVLSDTEDTSNDLRLYETLFGRDSLIVSRFLLKTYPKIARATIIALAKLQGVRIDQRAEEEPGKIMHEFRHADDPIGQDLMRQGWSFPYYGSIDATPLFVALVHSYVATAGDDILNFSYIDRAEQQSTIRAAVLKATQWIIAHTDKHPEGLLEFKRINPKGLSNQSWKDSYDSYVHPDGTRARSDDGIASIEVQGYVYDALLATAEIIERTSGAEKDDMTFTPGELRQRARKLRDTIFSLFAVSDDRGPFFAEGRDRDTNGVLRPIASRTSNMGHLLASHIFDNLGEKAHEVRDQIIDALLSPDLLSDRGIRTLSLAHPRYIPSGYHNGTVWLWDTYYIACGLRAQGYIREAKDLEDRIIRVVAKTKRYPEFTRGDDHGPILNTHIVDIWSARDRQVNRVAQPPQEVQSWTLAAMISLMSERGLTPKDLTEFIK